MVGLARVRLSTALTRSLAAAQIPPEREAVATLAKRYAEALDEDPALLVKLGPQMLTVLDALGLTRSAAVAVTRGEVPADGRSGTAGATLTVLRDRARTRRGQTA